MHIETTNYENLECYVTNRDKLTNFEIFYTDGKHFTQCFLDNLFVLFENFGSIDFKNGNLRFIFGFILMYLKTTGHEAVEFLLLY